MIYADCGCCTDEVLETGRQIDGRPEIFCLDHMEEERMAREILRQQAFPEFTILPL